MMKIKKLLALLLCMTVLFSAVPMGVFATEKDEPKVITYVNPLYADEYVGKPFTLAAPVAKEEAPTLAEYYTSMEDVGAEARKQLVERKTTVTAHYSIPSSQATDENIRQYCYDIMDEAMSHTGKPTEGDYILWQFGRWRCSYSSSSSGGKVNLTYSYTMEYYTTASMEKEMDTKVKQVLDQLNLYNKSDYEKVCGIYKYICDNITYDYATLDDESYKLKYTAYAGLFDGTCVCQGYALLLYRFALELGVDARLIAGDGGGPHGWNIVKLGNYYYNADSTWDAGQTTYDYFLRGSNNFPGHTRYDEYETAEFHREFPTSKTDYRNCQGSSNYNDHNNVEKRIEPTCTEDGSVTTYCAGCGKVWSTTTLPATGHSYQGSTCSKCGYVKPATSGSCGDNAVWNLNSQGVLTIVGSGDLYDDTGKTCGWFASADKIKSINISEGITSIGDANFSGFKNLESITLPSTITSIGYSAFFGCESLNFLNIPANVSVIEDSAFALAGIKTFVFEGNPPAMSNGFYGVIATAYYPANNSLWTADKLVSYGGYITWKMEGEPLDTPVMTASHSSGLVSLGWNSIDGAVAYDVYYSTSETGTYKLLTSTDTLNCSDSLQVGQTKYYYVCARDYKDNVSEKSNIVSVKRNLGKPVVTASNVASSGKVKLTWNAVTGATEYKVYRATSKTGTYKLMKTTTGTSYTNTSAVAGTTYYYKVKAFKGDISSSYSDVKSRTCDLPKMSFTIANDAASGKPKLTWSKVEGAKSYKVYRATSSGGNYSLMKTVTGTSYINNSAVAGKTYYYKVMAVHSNSNANSALSGYKSRLCDLAKPVVKITTSSGKPKLSWAEVDGVKEYKIYRATSKTGTYKLVKTTTNEYWKDTTAKKGKTYYYKVRAVHKNSNANSVYSAIKSIKCTK